MKTDQDMENLLADFFQESEVDDGAVFVEQVMAALPPPASLMWWKDMAAAAAGFVVMLLVWKLGFMSPDLWISWLKQGAQSAAVHLPPFKSSLMVMIFVVLGVCYYVYEEALAE